MIVRGYEDGDVDRMVLQESQEITREWIKDLDLAPLVTNSMVWVAEDNESNVLAIAGIAPQWENRAIMWSMISPLAGRNMVAIHRAVIAKIDEVPFRRLEATVDVGFEPGLRWMRMLGFSVEGYLRAYRPDGGDQILYSRIKQ